MDKELALRTLGYLNGYYETHNETTINKQEIEAIEFILKDNEFLEQKDKNIKNAIKYLEKKRIRNKAIIDVDVLEGILNEVSE